MKKESGFTLIELMTVVAIIGILAALALPKFSQLVDKSRIAKYNTDVATAKEKGYSIPEKSDKVLEAEKRLKEAQSQSLGTQLQSTIDQKKREKLAQEIYVKAISAGRPVTRKEAYRLADEFLNEK